MFTTKARIAVSLCYSAGMVRGVPPYMRWSLRGMLGFFVVVSVALALGKYSPAVSGGVLMCVVIAAWFVLPANMWRRLAYGSVLGIVSVYCLLLGLLYVRLGRLVSSNYQQSSESIGIMDPWTPYVIPVGALLGASVAIAFTSIREQFDGRS